MAHAIEVHLSANVEKFNQGMAAAKKTTTENVGFIASIFNTVKSYFAGMWDSAKSFFSNLGDKAGAAWGSFKDSASGALEKVLSMLPGVGKATKDIGDEAEQSDKKTDSWLSKLGSALTAVIGIAAAAATAIGALAAKGLLIDSAFAKISVSTNVGAGTLSQFQDVAKRSGMTVEQLGTSVSKFQDAMKEAAAGTGASVFKELGVDVKDSNDQLLATGPTLVDFAKHVAAMSSEAEKYGAAAKAGFSVQFLEDLARSGKLVADTTDDQAAAAMRLQRIWHEVLPRGKSMWEDISTSLSNKLTPALTTASVAILEAKNKITDAFGQIYGGGSLFDKLGDKIKGWADGMAGYFASVVKSATGAAVSVAAYIAKATGLGGDLKTAPSAGNIPAQTPLVSGKPETVVSQADKDAAAKYDAATAALKKYAEGQQLVMKTGEALTQGQRMQLDLLAGLRDGTIKETDAQAASRQAMINTVLANEKQIASTGAARAAGEALAKKQADAYVSLTKSINEKLAASALEANGSAQLSESQRLTIKLNEDVRAGTIANTKANIDHARSVIAQIKVNEDVTASQKRAAAGAEAMAKMQKEYNDNRAKAVDDAVKEAEQYEKLAETFGMTKGAIEALELARLQDQYAQRASVGMTQDEIDVLEKLISAKQRSAGAAATIDGLEDQKKVWESVDKTAHDTFVSIFDSGKSAFDRLRDTLKNGLLDLLYQMVIKKWVLNIGASVGLTGASGLAEAAGVTGAGGAAGGATGLIGLAQTASSMYKAVTGGFTSMSSTVADAIQVGFDKVGLGGVFDSAAPGVNVATGITGNGAAASAAGTAAAYGAGMLAGHYIGNTIAGQYSVAHGQTVTNVATAVGAALLGPIGGVVGGVVGGLFNRAFGMGNKEVTATGMSGTLSDAGLSGSNYQKWHQDGGWFRSDKNGTDKAAFDPAVTAQFVQGFATIKAASTGFAASIGASTDSLAGYSKTFDIPLGKDATANEKAITDFFTGVGDEIALRLVPGLAQFNKSGETMATTLQRLAGDFDATNQVAMLLGKNGTSMFGSLTIDSAAARERLVELAGGVSNLTTQATAFAQNYLTEAERLKPVSEAVAAAMASLGLASVTTREQFKTVVQGLDVTTAAGAQQFASLMALSDAFAQVHPAIEATTAALRTEADVLSERKELQKQVDQLTMTSVQLRAKERAAIDASNVALFDQVTALQNAAAMSDTLKTSITSLKAFRDGILSFKDSLTLGSLSTLTPMQKAFEAQRQYQDMLAKANSGDSTAQSGIQAAATAYLTANQAINASSSAYVAAAAGVQADLAALATVAGTQLTDAQQQLAALDQQVSQLASLNATASSIEAALTMPSPTINWSEVGTTNMTPLAEEIKGLRADNADLRADNAKLIAAVNSQTDAVVQATLTAANNNAAAVNDGAQQAARSGNWAQQLIAEVTEKR